MSVFGKLLSPITVETGGWDFTFKEGAPDRTVTIPAGTYDTVLDLLAALSVVIDVLYTPVVTCSSTGIVVITIAEMTAMNWALTNDGFEQLGFSGTELVVGTSITSTTMHHWGWYPGVITFGAAGGSGLEGDTEWVPPEISEGMVSGAGEQAIVTPTRPPYEQNLSFGAIKRDEMRDRGRGPICLRDRWRMKVLRWYPDRDVGTVAVPDGPLGQGDPGHPYYDLGADCDYWNVTVVGEPMLERHSSHPEPGTTLKAIARIGRTRHQHSCRPTSPRTRRPAKAVTWSTPGIASGLARESCSFGTSMIGPTSSKGRARAASRSRRTSRLASAVEAPAALSAKCMVSPMAVRLLARR